MGLPLVTVSWMPPPLDIRRGLPIMSRQQRARPLSRNNRHEKWLPLSLLPILSCGKVRVFCMKMFYCPFEYTCLIYSFCIHLALASVMIPGATINMIVKASRLAASSAKLPVTAAAWGPTGVGLASIPFIIRPIDNAVDYLLDNTTRHWLVPDNENSR
jgi:hypothetical protein